ncbi:hypothetical protein HQ531_03995 [bacterium]|nr:hypothetical protein [bacterium]
MTLSDFQLEPGHHQPIGLPSGQILSPAQDFRIEIGHDSPTLELELAVPWEDISDQDLSINSRGSYALPQ